MGKVLRWLLFAPAFTALGGWLGRQGGLFIISGYSRDHPNQAEVVLACMVLLGLLGLIVGSTLALRWGGLGLRVPALVSLGGLGLMGYALHTDPAFGRQLGEGGGTLLMGAMLLPWMIDDARRERDDPEKGT